LGEAGRKKNEDSSQEDRTPKEKEVLGVPMKGETGNGKRAPTVPLRNETTCTLSRREGNEEVSGEGKSPGKILLN